MVGQQSKTIGTQLADTYSFGAVEVDLGTYSVRCSGVPLSLEPKVFDLLVYLIQNRERVVSKAELLREVWGGIAVTSTVVAQGVFVLRRALGDDGATQCIVRTVNRRGYQFVERLTRESETRDLDPSAVPVLARER